MSPLQYCCNNYSKQTARPIRLLFELLLGDFMSFSFFFLNEWIYLFVILMEKFLFVWNHHLQFHEFFLFTEWNARNMTTYVLFGYKCTQMLESLLYRRLELLHLDHKFLTSRPSAVFKILKTLNSFSRNNFSDVFP